MFWSKTLPYALFLTAVITLPLLLNRKLARDVFSPFSYLLYYDFILLVFPAFIIEFTVSDEYLLQRLPVTILLIGTSFLFVWFGYSQKWGRILASVVPLVGFPSQRANVPWLRILMLYGVGWIGRVVVMQKGFSHLPNEEVMRWQFLSIMRDLGYFSTLSFVLLAYHVLHRLRARQRAVDYLFLVSLTLLELFAGSLYGGRSTIVLPLLLLAFTYSMAVRPIRWIILLPISFLAILVLGPALSQYRDVFYTSMQEGVTSRLEIVSRALDSLQSQEKGGRDEWLQGFDVLAQRTGTFESVMRVLDRVPSVVDYAWGDTFVPDLLTVFIPRALWADKPVYLTGRYFEVVFWDGVGDYSSVGTSVGITIPGELYFNFGWFGLFGVIIVGVILRTLHEREILYAKFERHNEVVRRHFTVFFMASMSGMISGYIAGGIRMGLVYLFFLAIVNWSWPQIFRYRVLRG